MINDGLPGSAGADELKVSGVAVDSFDAGGVWVTYSGFDASDKVFWSYNYGATWYNITYNLPNVIVNCIEMKHVESHGTNEAPESAYIGTDVGIWRFNTTTQLWEEYDQGLPIVPVRDIDVNESAGLHTAATFGRGLWRSETAFCNSTLTESGTLPTGTHYRSAGTIYSTSEYSSGLSQNVNYGGGTIVLQNGFRVILNSRRLL